MSEQKPKTKWGCLVIPWMLAIVVAVGWSVYWFHARNVIETELDTRAEALRADGYNISWGERSIGGYPFRFFIQMENFQVGEPGGWGLAAPKVEAGASAMFGNVVVLTAPDGVVISRPEMPGIAVTGEVIRASIGGLGRPAPYRVSVEGIDLTLASSDPGLPFKEIGRFETHFRPEDGGEGQLVFRVVDAPVGGGGMLARAAGGRPVTLALEGRLTNTQHLVGDSWRAIMSRWSDAGGRLQIQQGGLEAGDALVVLRPATIGADASGRAVGELKLTLGATGEGLLALGEIGVLPPDTAESAADVAAMQSIFSSDATLDVSFDFRNGDAFIGPLPIGSAPRIYRPLDAVAPAETANTPSTE